MADFSLVIDRSKNVFALTGLNQMSQRWLTENQGEMKLMEMAGAYICGENVLIQNLTYLHANDFSVEVWNKKELTSIPEDSSDL